MKKLEQFTKEEIEKVESIMLNNSYKIEIFIDYFYFLAFNFGWVWSDEDINRETIYSLIKEHIFDCLVYGRVSSGRIMVEYSKENGLDLFIDV
jgi:hypothetical protein